MPLIALTRIPRRPGSTLEAAFWEPGDEIPADAPVDAERLVRVGAAEEQKPTAKKSAGKAAKAPDAPAVDAPPVDPAA